MLIKFSGVLANVVPPLPTSYWDGILAPVVVFAVVVITLGFLFLVGRLSWAAREYVLACRERQRAQRKLRDAARTGRAPGERGAGRGSTLVSLSRVVSVLERP